MGTENPLDPIARLACEDRSEIDAEYIDFYVSHAVKSGGPVLDLGCGAGFITVALAREGLEVVAVDFEPSAVQVTQERLQDAGLTDVEVIHDDIVEWSFPDGEFQTVFMANNVLGEVLELEHRAQVLSDIYDHMPAGGLLVLDVPMMREDAIVNHLGQVCHHWMDDSRIEQGWDIAWDPVARTLEGGSRIEDENGVRVLGSTCHVFTLQEIILALIVGGFEVQDYWGTVDGEDLTYQHEHCYVIATRDE